MIDISVWMNDFLRALDEKFAERVWFVGLGGSYSRGEASESSDIDTVVILDSLSAQDIESYGRMLDTLPHRELVCGFISGKDELLAWEPSDLFQFYHDTKPIKGSLDALLSLIDGEAVRRAVKLGACNIYHGCVHNMLHEKNADILAGLYKSASFVLQAKTFVETGRYISRQSDLLSVLSEDDRAVAENFLHLKRGGTVDFERASDVLFAWSKKLIKEV